MYDLKTSIGVIESVSGFTDEGTSANEAWVTVLAEITRLRAIGDKLPKTEDGVPFVCGMVFCLGSKGGDPAVFEYPAACRFVAGHPDIKPYICHAWGEAVGKCYSTREAAEAAKENTPNA